jgi:hypothetical protein
MGGRCCWSGVNGAEKSYRTRSFGARINGGHRSSFSISATVPPPESDRAKSVW